MNADYRIFMTESGLNSSIVSTFIDNVKIIASEKTRIIQHIKAELTDMFLIVDIGPISFYLGLTVD